MVMHMLGSLVRNKTWEDMEARSRSLPVPYQEAYTEIKKYAWKMTYKDGKRTVVALNEILQDFEASAAAGTPLREVVGIDAAQYCDAHLAASGAVSHVAAWQDTLNRALTNQATDPDLRPGRGPA